MPTSLTSKLVVITVALVAGAALLIGTITTLAMRGQLDNRLDRDAHAALDRALHARGPDGPPGLPPPATDHDGDEGFEPIEGQAQDTLIAVCTGDPTTSQGEVVGSGSLTSAQTQTACQVDTGLATVAIPDLGRYRVAARLVPDGMVVAGVPTDDAEDSLESLILWELALGLAAVALAGGLAVVVVRRQLRPLREVAATAHEVAALPLSSGEPGLTARVPDRLTDERTEVGQVGAALNTLLAHVEASLEARHRSEEQVRQFVADASHELRTPLATITGYAELARRRPDDTAALQTAMAKVDAESARMAGLVEDLLLLARLDSGRPIADGSVDLSRVLVEAVNDARILGPDHTWRLDLPEDTVVEVAGDEHRLHQVVTNLLTNARRHTPAGTTVTVTARPAGAGHPAVLTVHDDGPGFPPELAAEAFTRFSRGDTARTRGDGGAGLGLSLVQAIVEAHGGTVALSSEPGSTTFRIELPGEALEA